jgi:Rrf2 family protein
VDITRRTDYAIRMMMALAASAACPVSVRTLSEAQGVPYAFGRAVQRDLAAAGLVTTTRGASGGMCLSRNAEEISLLDIVQATQGLPSVAVCASDPAWCSRAGSCTVHAVWRGADAMLRDYLGSRTLGGLVHDERK